MATLYTVPGYSQAIIRQNFVTLRAMGETKGAAISKAHKIARDTWHAANPGKPLPWWIYKQDVSVPRRKVKANPAPRSDAFEVANAAKLSRRFVGREPTNAAKTRKPRIPDALACIGQVSVIQYVAERDGEVNEYRHPFRAKSRPHLCVSPDGKLVLMLGGAFTFTEDGFVDE